MTNKVLRIFFGYSALLVVVGIVAIRYYYASSIRSFAVLGIVLLGIGLISLVASTIYTLHAKGKKTLTWLFSSSVACLFLGLGLLFINRYKMSHLDYAGHKSELDFYSNIVQPVGVVLFLAGLALLIFTIGFAIVRKLKGKHLYG